MDLIPQIKAAIKLEEYMEESGVEIVRRGKDSWTARCWRHEDKTPSLVVSIRKGLYNCFSTGCGAGGDVITFHEEFNLCDRDVAIRELATRLGLKSTHGEISPTRELMQRVNDACTIELFANQGVLDYCRKRGVSEETLVEFQVGYSPSVRWLRSQLSPSDPKALKSLELDSFKYERSLVLPCISPAGDVAHYVRPMNPSKSGSKYLGPSASNPSRWKGMMFGLQASRKCVREHGRLILVEGQFDAMALYSGGFPNVVCMLGSHPDEAQLEVLRSIHVPAVTVLFDGDAAGVAGAEVALRVFTPSIHVSIARLHAGDPDEVLARDGEAALREVIDGALQPVDYIIEKYEGALSGDSRQMAEGLRGAVNDLARLSKADFLAGIALLSRGSGVPAESLLDLIVESAPDLRSLVEAERQVLSMLIRSPDCVSLVAALPDDVWSVARHRKVYSIIKDLVGRGAVHITPELVLTKLADPAANGSVSGLFDLEPDNLEYNLGQLKEAYIRRKLLASARRFAHDATDAKRRIGDVISAHLSEVSSSASPASKSEFTAAEVVEGAIEFVAERMAKPDALPGLDLGRKWQNTTKVLLGLQRNRLYLVGAGPKVGKTSLALNWAYHAIKGKVPTLWVNLEMSERDLMMRLFSISSGLSSLRVQAGALGEKEKALLDSHAAEIYSSPFHIFNGFGLSIQEIIAGMRKYVFSHAVSLIFIDYIQLLNVSGGSRLDYWERHAQISTDLKGAINGNLGVPVVALSQLGRPAAHEGSSSGSFIGGSYKYVQDCDVFMGLRTRTTKELEDGESGNLVLNVEYNRHGPQDVYSRIYFNKDNLQMEEA